MPAKRRKKAASPKKKKTRSAGPKRKSPGCCLGCIAFELIGIGFTALSSVAIYELHAINLRPYLPVSMVRELPHVMMGPWFLALLLAVGHVFAGTALYFQKLWGLYGTVIVGGFTVGLSAVLGYQHRAWQPIGTAVWELILLIYLLLPSVRRNFS